MDEKKLRGIVAEQINQVSKSLSDKAKEIFEKIEPYEFKVANTPKQNGDRIRKIDFALTSFKNTDFFKALLSHIPKEKGYDYGFLEFTLLSFCAVKINLEYAKLIFERWQGSIKEGEIETMEGFIEKSAGILVNRIAYEKIGKSDKLRDELNSLELEITPYAKKIFPIVYKIHKAGQPISENEKKQLKKETLNRMFFNLS